MGDGIVERTESFQCTIKAVFSSQDIPFLLESDKSTALVIINDYDYLPLVFAGIFSVGDPYNRIVYTAYENVSTVPLRIVAYGTASFEYKMQLYVAQYIASLPGQENATGEEIFPFRIYISVWGALCVKSMQKLGYINIVDLYYTSGCIFLYIRIYIIHPDLYYTSGSILYIRIYTIHPDLYYTSGSILYIWIYTIHPDLY